VTEPLRAPRTFPGLVVTLGVLYESATDPLPGSGCRRWAGRMDRSTGYPAPIAGIRVHRLVMALARGWDPRTLPSDLQARHLCHDRRCIEAAHIVPGSAQQNAEDTVRDGRSPVAFLGPVCKRGHDLTRPGAIREGKPLPSGRPRRFCAECARLSAARSRLRARGLTPCAFPACPRLPSPGGDYCARHEAIVRAAERMEGLTRPEEPGPSPT